MSNILQAVSTDGLMAKRTYTLKFQDQKPTLESPLVTQTGETEVGELLGGWGAFIVDVLE